MRTGRIDRFGRLVDGADRFLLEADRNIFVCEQDISELAQAKGANIAGSNVVVKNYGIDLNRIDRFYLAGGFGRRLNLDAARRIGLIPDLPSEKIIQVGNASIAGATMALRSVSARRELDRLVRRAVHVELETDEQFFDFFVDGCQFLPVRGHKIHNQ